MVSEIDVGGSVGGKEVQKWLVSLLLPYEAYLPVTLVGVTPSVEGELN